MLGLAVGDALGWPMEDRGGRVGGTASLRARWEFETWTRREGGGYAPNIQSVDGGAVSDDTQLAIAVARSLLRGNRWWQHLTEVELPLWTVYERGGGGATKRAAQSWLQQREPWNDPNDKRRQRYFEAGGNGTAMRCLPHCFSGPATDRLIGRLDLDAVSTHGHPFALLGSRIFGWAGRWCLLRDGALAYGELVERVLDAAPEWSRLPELPAEWAEAADRHHRGFDRAWGNAIDETIHLLRVAQEGLAQGVIVDDRQVLESLGAFGPAKGAGHVTAVAAVFLAARYLTQPREGVMTAAFARGADTDTLAAMTGGLLGALTDDAWLWPLQSEIQDAEYTGDLAIKVSLGERAALCEPFGTRKRTELYRFLDEATTSSKFDLSVFGQVEVARHEDLEARSQFVRVWTLATTSGQTILVKRYDKGVDGRARWSPVRAEADPSVPIEPPRGGVALVVADLQAASRFYTEIIGLPEGRRGPNYVSLDGWLILEEDERGELTLRSPAVDGPALRFYYRPDALERVLRRLRAEALRVESQERHGKTVFVVHDPDGNTLELHRRNGTPTPLPAAGSGVTDPRG